MLQDRDRRCSHTMLCKPFLYIGVSRDAGPRPVDLAVSVTASHVVGRPDHHKNCTKYLPAWHVCRPCETIELTATSWNFSFCRRVEKVCVDRQLFRYS